MARKFFKILDEYKFSGFGTRIENQPDRLINQDGSVNTRKSGMGFLAHFSVFHFLVTTKWWKFNVLVILSYLSINIFFGFIYAVFGVEDLGIRENTFTQELLRAFYFSAQTFSTVGYGRLNPQGHWLNIVSVIEMLIGMMYLALTAGLLFARFSRPVSKIIFSKNALIGPYQDTTAIMFRLANAKENLLFDVDIKVLLTMTLVENGENKRKFYQLPLEMDRINMLALSWTVVHPIDKDSPLAGMSKEEFDKTNPEILALLRGFNNTFSQDIHAQSSYKHYDLVWGAKFKPIFSNKRGKTIVELNRINDYDPESIE